MSQQETKSNLEALSAALEVGELQQLRFMLNKGLKPVEVAHLLEKTPPRERQILWNLLNQELEGEVLQYLGDDAQTEILSRMEASEVLAITESLETDDMADILQQLPERVMKELLQIMDQQNRERVEEVLAYPEDTAGGLMNTDTVTIRPDINVETVLRYLRRHKDIPEMTDTLFVVSRKDSYIGVLPLTRLLTADPGVLVREIMQTDVEPIPADMPDESVARLFEQLDLISAPVVNEEGRLLGRITIDDVVDDDEDTFAPIMKTTRRRAVWLGINLITAFAASAVIGLFEATIDKVVALAVLMPIVASMGGIAGSQTLTLVIRGQALGHIERSNIGWLFNRELVVGLLNGMLWALVVAVVAVLWFQDMTVGIVIAMALVINLIAGAMAGTLLPTILKSMGIDPALAGGVLLTTITDVVGFFAFLGLATLFFA
jgi:magnesium transporter